MVAMGCLKDGEDKGQVCRGCEAADSDAYNSEGLRGLAAIRAEARRSST